MSFIHRCIVGFTLANFLIATSAAQETTLPTGSLSKDVANENEVELLPDDLLRLYRKKAIDKWEDDIVKLENRDLLEQHGPQSILVIGSSSIRRWNTIQRDLSPYSAIQRGYGGAKFTDMAVFAERLIRPHKFRALIIFIGNGITGKPDDHTPDQIEPLARYIVSVAHKYQPDSPVFFVEITPCEKRFAVWPQIRGVNAMLREVALTTPYTYFIPTADHFMDPLSQPRPDLFVDDKLHLNDTGYQIWGTLIRHRLDDTFRSIQQNSSIEE